MIIITVAHGPDKGKVFHLSGNGPHGIGHHHADIKLNDPKVSREHGSLESRDGGWLLKDTGSRTGTLVNGHRAREPRPIEDGARVHLGESMLIINFVPEMHVPLEADPAQINHELEALAQRIDQIVGEQRNAATRDEHLVMQLDALSEDAEAKTGLLPKIAERLDQLDAAPARAPDDGGVNEQFSNQFKEQLEEQFNELRALVRTDDQNRRLQAIGERLEELTTFRRTDTEAQERLGAQVEALTRGTETQNRLLPQIAEQLEHLTTPNGQEVKLNEITQRLEQISAPNGQEAKLNEITEQLQNLASANGHDAKLTEIAERLEQVRKLAGADEHRERYETLVEKIEGLAAAQRAANDRDDRLTDQLAALAVGVNEQKRLLPAIHDQIQQLAGANDNGHEERLVALVDKFEGLCEDRSRDARLDSLMERLDRLPSEQRLGQLLGEVGKLAQTAVEERGLLPRINDQLQSLATDNGHDQQLALAMSRENREQVASQLQSIAEARGDEQQLLGQILEQMQRVAGRADNDESRANAILGKLGSMSEAANAQPILDELRNLTRTRPDDGRLLVQVMERLDQLANGQQAAHAAGATAAPLLTGTTANDGQALATAADHTALERRLDAIEQAMQIGPQSPTGQIFSRLFAALQFIQAQQHQANQVLVRLATAVDPTTSWQPVTAAAPAPTAPAPAEPKAVTRSIAQPARPEYARTAAMVGVGLLFVGMLCCLVVMVAGIARHTIEFMN